MTHDQQWCGYVTHSAFSQSKYPFANEAIDSAVNIRLACCTEERSGLSGCAAVLKDYDCQYKTPASWIR